MTENTLLEFSQVGRITVGTIHSTSVLDALNVSEFGNHAVAKVGKSKGVQLLLNFERVNYLSSAVLTELLRIKEAAETNGGSLRLCALNKDIRQVFEITNLERVFVIYDDVDAAVKRYERSLDVEAQEKAWANDED